MNLFEIFKSTLDSWVTGVVAMSFSSRKFGCDKVVITQATIHITLMSMITHVTILCFSREHFDAIEVVCRLYFRESGIINASHVDYMTRSEDPLQKTQWLLLKLARISILSQSYITIFGLRKT